jgi:uncharacterized protein (TIGR00730 family)
LANSIKAITVYCGSADHLSKDYIQAAYDLGKMLATQGKILVFGGGRTGMMEAVADGALENGGEVIGVINDGLNTPRLARTGLTRMEVFPDIQARKARMSELADAFIALPGGFGTFDELFEALTWAQIGLHHKPIGLMNINHYFNPLIQLVEHAIKEGFIYPEHRGLFTSAAAPAELLSLLEDWSPPEDLARWVERPE